MKEKLKCVMLVDDNPDDNFFHERVIRKAGYFEKVMAMQSAIEALQYLRSTDEYPNLIIIDINMPGMNGWEFLEEFKKLNSASQSGVVIAMLSTSLNPDDEERAKNQRLISCFKTKPLTKEILDEILQKGFPGYL